MSFDISLLLRAAGGKIVGKVRLQKYVYLLNQLGLDGDLSFEYHHYGPYSEELADELEDSIAFNRIRSSNERRVSDGVRYSVFYAPEQSDDASESLGHIPLRRAEDYLSKMNAHSSTVLELAATIHWLACVEIIQDWYPELLRRKGVKAASGRTEEAVGLLRELQLPPG
ncbi:MAG TPA: hypothetical protein VH000_00780 [Rhizomicrobium sp.]|jgi:uncharacterized protein YwgA|nr:hypothetical protein [Rhizomicrobium sp.]